MSKISIELFGSDAELAFFNDDGEKNIVFEFNEDLDGYISLGTAMSRIKGRSCSLDVRRIPDGKYQPHLILLNETIDLPTLSFLYGVIKPLSADSDYISRLSIGHKRLIKRVDELEERIEKLNERIVGSKLFDNAP